MKTIKYYELYAERHPDYGRTVIGNYSTHRLAKKILGDMKKKHVGKGLESTDGYFEGDWDIEEIKIKIQTKLGE